MGNALLFKWEDSPALNHHCGFCERPLSHPGARSSCYGTHAAMPQTMFMRLRGHTCGYCKTIDEAHHRRHRNIAERIRHVYESCGLQDWTIIPAPPEERGRAKDHDSHLADGDDMDRTIAAEEALASKREKKDAKALARAASRCRLTSQDEMVYIDSVMHPAQGLLIGNEGPRNTEEMEEIERHLTYNANVYNSELERRELRKYARLPQVDVDFDAEIQRVFEAFRITKLLKINTRNRGLERRELKMFQGLVEILKKALVDDLVQVKRDILETRMRRAGYLRYTNKTAHGIVEDRYTDKDWKTGEKYSATTNSPSDIVQPAELPHAGYGTPPDNLPTTLPSKPQHQQRLPDRRHLEQIHMRVSGEDGLGQKVIEPFDAPLVPLEPMATLRKPAVQLKVVVPESLPSSSSQKKPPHGNRDTWETVLHRKNSKTLTVKSSCAKFSAGEPVEITDLPSVRFPAVQPPEHTTVTASKVPEGFVSCSESVAEEPTVTHAVMSQRKVKKHEREARRKAKKSVAQLVAEPNVGMITGKGDHKEQCHDASTNISAVSIEHTSNHESSESSRDEMMDDAMSTLAAKKSDSEPCIPPANDTPSPVLPRKTYNSKHIHWMQFECHFIFDRLTGPLLPADVGCNHSNTCVFETNGEVDCPYHKPHCSCVDPLMDPCYLSYPNKYVSGPFNRIQAERLFAMYQQDDNLRDCIMLVDKELMNYVMQDKELRITNRVPMPSGLAAEYADFADGYDPGPLMHQEKRFETLRNKNNIVKKKVNKYMLSELARGAVDADRPFMCYCHVNVPSDGLPANTVSCAHRDCLIKHFHKVCIKKLGVDKNLKTLKEKIIMSEGTIQNLKEQMEKVGMDVKLVTAFAMTEQA
ncbi:hypothetical protein ACEQ8H_007014 [Pleosporales sp. CAS-2024a]